MADNADGLLLGADDEEEVDEPINAGSSSTNAAGGILISNIDDEEEEDEPLQVDNKGDSKTLLLVNEGEGDEVNEPLPMDVTSGVGEGNGAALCSTEFAEAVAAIATDCWDISSWIILIEEVQQGRGGEMTQIEAYGRIINQFPRSAKFWKNLAEHYSSIGDHAAVETAYKKCVQNCRNIELWISYLEHLLVPFNETLTVSVQTGEYNITRERCEAAFEEGVANVGLALGAFPLWRRYIDFVKSWPEAGMIESMKKLHTLRNLYQRAVSVCMDNADEIWTEYEEFEKTSSGEQGSEPILAEFNRKYLHARSIARERKKLMSGIVFDRLATPPTNSTIEMQQIDYWNNWISFEKQGPDYLNPDSYLPMVRMVFEQCLCCFRYNAEVWLSYAHFECYVIIPKPFTPPTGDAGKDSAGGLTADGAANAATTGSTGAITSNQVSTRLVVRDALMDEDAANRSRAVYLEAIDAIPNINILRLGLAELEECAGDSEAAKEVLRISFEQLPSGFTFSMYQRFIRRNLGITAARRLFSETLPMRKADPVLGIELFLATAKLEAEVNCSPKTALNVLNVAQKVHPECMRNVHYIKAVAKVLMLLGDLKQLRWVFQSALREVNPDNASLVVISGAHMRMRAGGVPAALTVGGRIPRKYQDPGVSSSGGGGGGGGKHSLQGGGSAEGIHGERKANTAAAADGPGSSSGGTAAMTKYERLKTELELWNEYLYAESALGVSDVMRLNELRMHRDRVRAMFEDMERVKLGVIFSSREEARTAAARQRGIFGVTQDIFERYDPSIGGGGGGGGGGRTGGATRDAGELNTVIGWDIPEMENDLRQRSRGRHYRDIQARREMDILYGVSSGGSSLPQLQPGSHKRDRHHVLNMSTEFHLSLVGLPANLRDLLAKLPFHSGPLPDIDGFVRHVKSIILPPRPDPMEDNFTSASVADGTGGDEDGDRDANIAAQQEQQAQQRQPDWMDSSSAAAAGEEELVQEAHLGGGGGGGGGGDGVVAAGGVSVLTSPAAAALSSSKTAAAEPAVEEDVFRKRRKTTKSKA